MVPGFRVMKPNSEGMSPKSGGIAHLKVRAWRDTKSAWLEQ